MPIGKGSEFIWRPNSNTSTVLNRYWSEATHWTRAFKQAAYAQRDRPLAPQLEGFRLLLMLPLLIILIVVLEVSTLLGKIYQRSEKSDVVVSNTTKLPKSEIAFAKSLSKVPKTYRNDGYDAERQKLDSM